MAVQFSASEVNPEITVLSLSGRLDLEAVEAATPVVQSALEQCAAGMVVDLRRVDFISAYLGAQSLADGPQKIAQIKQEAAIELKRVKLALDEELEEIEAQAPESESFFSQFFLFYKMKSFWSGLLRLGFYLVLLLTLAWSTLVTGQQSVMLGTGEINLASFILGLLVYVVPPILAALFIRWLAIRLHRRSTRA